MRQAFVRRAVIEWFEKHPGTWVTALQLNQHLERGRSLSSVGSLSHILAFLRNDGYLESERVPFARSYRYRLKNPEKRPAISPNLEQQVLGVLKQAQKPLTAAQVNVALARKPGKKMEDGIRHALLDLFLDDKVTRTTHHDHSLPSKWVFIYHAQS